MPLIKCSECGKEISSSATACPNCGHPAAVAMSRTPEPAASSPSGHRIGTLQGLFLILIVPIIGGWFILNSENQKAGPASSKSSQGAATKAAWRQKFRDNFPNNMGMVPVAQLRTVFGQPRSTQTVGDETYWYYGCSDGSIQVVIKGYQVLGNSAYTDSINDY
jgi:hypothetical protein